MAADACKLKACMLPHNSYRFRHRIADNVATH